jgi:hypothetical protein
LGQSVPFSDLKKIAESFPCKNLVTVITGQLPNYTTQEYLDLLSTTFKTHTSYISGFQAMNPNLNIPKNLKLFNEPAELPLLVAKNL